MHVMPTYLYEIICDNGNAGECFEAEHPMTETLQSHPVTGQPVRRVYTPPHLGIRYTQGHTKQLLSNENIAQKGFTKYERDRVSGKYHKVVGDGPAEIQKPL
jgi:hypothetical protein